MLKRQGNIYKNSTGTNIYNVVNNTATSYGWWTYYKIIKGKRIFNSYFYSSTTSKHQIDLLKIVRPDIYIECPGGLQDLRSGIDYYKSLIRDLVSKINNPRSRKTTNEKRMEMIIGYKNKITQIYQLLGESI